MPKIKDILKGIDHEPDNSYSGINAKGISDDSRHIKRGDIFIAARGYDTDGYKFINKAITGGAGVIISDRDFKAPENIKKIIVKDARASLSIIADNFYGHPSEKLKLVGITGTNGKTTITYLIESILNAAKKRSGVIGTVNYRIGKKSIPATNTTPGPVLLRSLLSKMVKAGAGYAIMEVSSHSLDQDRVQGLSFDVGIFTNITREHLDYHKTVSKYFNAKAKLFKKLKVSGTAILNNDDKLVASLKRRIRGKVLTYGLGNRSDVSARDIKLSIDSSNFVIATPRGSFGVTTKLIGKHNISNILASVAAAIALGIDLKIMKKGIESFKFVPGRLEPVKAGQPFKIFVDYAHTEDAMYNVLSLLRDVVKDGRIITVFGCGGNRDRTKRPAMGSVACKFSDRVVVTSDNPRFEDPMSIIGEIEEGIRGKFSNYDIVPDRHDAIAKAMKLARERDIVIIAGKGHEKYQIIRDRTISFDDCEVARSLTGKI